MDELTREIMSELIIGDEDGNYEYFDSRLGKISISIKTIEATNAGGATYAEVDDEILKWHLSDGF